MSNSCQIGGWLATHVLIPYQPARPVECSSSLLPSGIMDLFLIGSLFFELHRTAGWNRNLRCGDPSGSRFCSFKPRHAQKKTHLKQHFVQALAGLYGQAHSDSTCFPKRLALDGKLKIPFEIDLSGGTVVIFQSLFHRCTGGDGPISWSGKPLVSFSGRSFLFKFVVVALIIMWKPASQF